MINEKEIRSKREDLIQRIKELDSLLVAFSGGVDSTFLLAAAHDLLLCIGTNASIKDENRIKMPGDFFYLKSPQEMAEQFQDIPEALENTERIADMCNLKLDFGRLHLPEIELPKDRSADQFLADLCHEGLSRHYPQATPEIEKRLNYELEVITKTQFANYFLVV